MLLGAILSVFASILDGCDGEVARLTFQDSAFGCWLETICDYLYYVFIFAGMMIGLLGRGPVYWTWGALLFVGAVASFADDGDAAAQNGRGPSRAVSEPVAGAGVQTTLQSVSVPQPPHGVPDQTLLHALSGPCVRTVRCDLHGIYRRRRRGEHRLADRPVLIFHLQPGSDAP